MAIQTIDLTKDRENWDRVFAAYWGTTQMRLFATHEAAVEYINKQVPHMDIRILGVYL